MGFWGCVFRFESINYKLNLIRIRFRVIRYFLCSYKMFEVMNHILSLGLSLGDHGLKLL